MGKQRSSAIKTERLSSDLLDVLHAANKRLERAQVIRDGIVQGIWERYKLQGEDKLNAETGEIVRGKELK